MVFSALDCLAFDYVMQLPPPPACDYEVKNCLCVSCVQLIDLTVDLFGCRSLPPSSDGVNVSVVVILQYYHKIGWINSAAYVA